MPRSAADIRTALDGRTVNVSGGPSGSLDVSHDNTTAGDQVGRLLPYSGGSAVQTRMSWHAGQPSAKYDVQDMTSTCRFVATAASPF